jgi:hypothetical protein
MADNILDIKGDPRVLSFKSVEALTSTDFAGETISPNADCIIRSIYWDKPADCALTITLLSDAGGSPVGAEVVLVDDSSSTSGAAGAGRPLPAYANSTGGRLSITTTKVTSGTVTITVVASPAHVGV